MNNLMTANNILLMLEVAFASIMFLTAGHLAGEGEWRRSARMALIGVAFLMLTILNVSLTQQGIR